MAADRTDVRGLRRLFRSAKVLTLSELAGRLDCSPRTVQRRFDRCQILNSYNHNGRYYTLSDIPRFDADGLWHYRGIGFSRYGNLMRTVVGLVKDSQAGLSSSELGKLLGMAPRSFLWHFRDHAALKREDWQGRFVHFCSEPAVYRRQRRRRSVIGVAGKRPSDSVAIAILVAITKQPDLSLEQLCRYLNREGIKVNVQTISNLLAYHGLEQKKTPPSRS